MPTPHHAYYLNNKTLTLVLSSIHAVAMSCPASNGGSLQRRVISLILSSEDDLLKENQNSEFLILLPGKILPCDTTNWSILVNSLVLAGIKPDSYGSDCVTLLILSRTLAREQAVGPRLLPVLGIFYYYKGKTRFALEYSKVHLIPITELPDNCNSDVVDLAITNIHGEVLTSENFDKKAGFTCTLLLTRTDKLH